jgi:hypothetical protein
MTPVGREQRRRGRLRHSLYTMQKAVALLGAWRAALIADLGGPEAVSTQQLAIIEKAVTQRLICDSLDGYVLGMVSLVNKRHRTLWPVVRERAAQVALLQSLLRDLGLERRVKQIDLAAQLAALHQLPATTPIPGSK